MKLHVNIEKRRFDMPVEINLITARKKSQIVHAFMGEIVFVEGFLQNSFVG